MEVYFILNMLPMMRILFVLIFSGVMALSSVLSVAAMSYPTSDEIPLLFKNVMNTTFSHLPDGAWQAKNAEHLQNRSAAGYLKRV